MVCIRTVDSDPHQVADLLNLAASQLKWSQVPEYEMAISAASLELVSVFHESRGECPCISNDLFCICTEGRLCNLQESCRDASDGLMGSYISQSDQVEERGWYIVVGSSLACREDGFIDALLQIWSMFKIFPEENKTRTRSTEC